MEIINKTTYKQKQSLRFQIRQNRDKLLGLAFEEKTDWKMISKLALENDRIEKELKELK